MGPFCPPLYNIKIILGYFRGYFRGHFIFMYGFAVIDFQVLLFRSKISVESHFLGIHKRL